MARRRRFSESPPSDILVVYLLFLFPLLCLLHFQIMTVSADTAPRVSDRDALLRFKSAVSSDPSGLLSGWSDSPGSNHCAWAGVTCDSRSRVWALNLSHEVLPCDLSSKGSGNSSSCLGSKSRLVGELSPAIGDLSELRVLAMPFHGLVGQLPSEISKLNCLEVLDLRGNSLSGPLPSRLGPRLRVLSLGLNRFDGEIPGFLSSCTYLEAVDLSHNDLTGAIPAFLGGLYNLKELRLSFNRLNGTIPVEIGDNCSRLESLDLSGNMLVGGIPDRLGNCTSLRSLMLYSNHLDSGIPASFTRLSSLRHLSLADNNLTGGIPAGSAGWKSLELLDLSSNSLSGEIPSDLSTLRSLSVLLLHNNYFSGLIPASFNNLSGPIPRNASVGPENVLGNPLLDRTSDASSSSSSSALLLPSEPVARVRRFLQDTASADGNQSGKGTGSKNFSAIEIASITSASAIVSVLLALIVVYIYTRKCGKRSAVVSSARREVTLFREPGARLTYEIVIRATGNFNASNCIGSGGFGATYRAEIAPGILVAIKRLSAGRFHGLRQFHAEIKTLGRLQHSNLVTLYGYHVSESETFLIYNYLPGGNLENFIRKRSKRPIQWRMLHKIALDVACALAYLHDVCLPRILHRDVKPSNILLDNECNAYLSDFGLARLLGNSETHATTNVEGTFGYVAPEYAMTCRVSDRADVYSYGVVLLELISDKKALDPSFSPYANGFNIVQWARMLLEKGRAREFFFEGLWDVGPHDDLVEILRLAINCSDDTLSRRPKMKEVVQRLKQLQPPTF